MKKTILIALLGTTVIAGITPKRQALYRCVDLASSSKVLDVTIFKSKLGTNSFFEVKVHAFEHGKEHSYIKKVNKISRYGDRVQEYTTGNFRIKLDRVRKNEHGHFYAFARIPDQGIHSQNWSCKDY